MNKAFFCAVIFAIGSSAIAMETKNIGFAPQTAISVEREKLLNSHEIEQRKGELIIVTSAAITIVIDPKKQKKEKQKLNAPSAPSSGDSPEHLFPGQKGNGLGSSEVMKEHLYGVENKSWF